MCTCICFHDLDVSDNDCTYDISTYIAARGRKSFVFLDSVYLGKCSLLLILLTC